MTNFERVMETPLKDLWKNLDEYKLAYLISHSNLDCKDCMLHDICDMDGLGYTCYDFIRDWLKSDSQK